MAADRKGLQPGKVRTTKDKSYQDFPLGELGARFLRAKRGQFTDTTYITYETMLDKLARAYPTCDAADFEPPAGRDLLERFMDDHWGSAAARTYNKNLSMLREFFKWLRLHDEITGDPTVTLEPHRRRQPVRETYSDEDCAAIIAAQDGDGDPLVAMRDRIALHLLLDFGLRKGSLRQVQFKHFDHKRRWLRVFYKGQKNRWMPIPSTDLWDELEVYAANRQPIDYLMCREKASPIYLEGFRNKRPGAKPDRINRKQYHDQPMSGNGLHNWWYRCLERAGYVAPGQRSGARMHNARHTAGQRVLDRTRGNLKATQELLGHASIATTGDVYTDWGIYQLEDTLSDLYGDDES